MFGAALIKIRYLELGYILFYPTKASALNRFKIVWVIVVVGKF